MSVSRHLSPRAFTLDRDARRRLVFVDAEGRRHADCEPVRCFPITHPDRWIAICDAGGHEIARIADIGALPAEVRRMLEEELAAQEFVPLITRIIDATEGSEHYCWEVETDRGPTTFRTGDENAVRRLDGRRAMILDLVGIRYLIPDIGALDRRSQRSLDRYL